MRLLQRFFSLLFLSFLFLATPGRAQNEIPVIDSLKKELKQLPADTSRIRKMIQLAIEYQFYKTDSAEKYSQIIIAESDRLGYREGKAEGAFIQGYLAYVKGEYDKAFLHYDQAASIFEESKDDYSRAKVMYQKGIVYVYRGNYAKANESFFDALRIGERTGNNRVVSNCLVAISNVYGRQKNYDKQLEYLQKGLQSKIEAKDDYGIAACYINLGNVFIAKQQQDSAMTYYQKALQLAERMQNPKWMNNALGSIATVYNLRKQHDVALTYGLRALAIAQKSGDKQAEIEDLQNLGSTYEGLKQPGEAANCYMRCIELSEQIGSPVDLQHAYEALSSVHASQKNFSEAYKYHLLFTNLKDSLELKENEKALAEISTRYESEKKDDKIKLLTKDTELQNNSLKQKQLIIRSGAVAFAIVLLLSFFILREYRQKKKSNQKLEVAYSQIEEKNKDITDSIRYAQRIQQAILPPDTLVRELLPDSFILYRPKDIVSGDFYWVEKQNGCVLFAAADCTGHGVPGALMSIVGSNLLNQAVNEYHLSAPHLILDHLNSGLTQTLHQKADENGIRDGMDIALCSLELETRMLQFSAAFNSLYLVRNAELKEIKGDKFPVGTFIGEEVRKFSRNGMQLQKGDQLYIFTDGYADQFGGSKGKKFKYRQLQQTLLALSSLPMSEQQKRLGLILDEWQGNLEQVDDILVIGVRIS
jgi:serine phosphatase RsbU (regulator of sigma subunit)